MQGTPFHYTRDHKLGRGIEQSEPFPPNTRPQVTPHVRTSQPTNVGTMISLNSNLRSHVLSSQEICQHLDCFRLFIEAETKFLLRHLPNRKRLVLRDAVRMFNNNLLQLKHSDDGPKIPLGRAVSCPTAPSLWRDPRINRHSSPSSTNTCPKSLGCVSKHKQVTFLGDHEQSLPKNYRTNK